MPPLLRTLPVVALISGASLTGVQAACATSHVAATLTNFPSEAISSPFYWTAESTREVTFVLRAIGDDCTPQAVTISYATKDGSASSATDYVPNSGQRVVATDPTHGPNDRLPVSVTVVDDVVPEPALEFAYVELTGVQGGHLAPPTIAALHVIDDDGPVARVTLDGQASYRQLETYSGAGVPVFRGGSADVVTTVNYSLDPGPAPAAKPGLDYKGESGTLTFAPEERVKFIPFTIINDKETEGEKKFTVTLTGIDGGAFDGTTSAVFTILDNEETGAPISLFHHPRNTWKYKSSDYRIREVHVFTKDTGGAGVTTANFALRKNLGGGSCAWWSGKSWKNRPCKKELWKKMGKYETDFFFIRVPELESSMSGEIQSYTAFSRAKDGAGNTERKLEKGRNANTFEIR